MGRDGSERQGLVDGIHPDPISNTNPNPSHKPLLDTNGVNSIEQLGGGF